MIILPLLPLVASLALAPSDPPASPAEHPHYPMVTKVAGVKGNISVSWFTVPHNPEQVKKAKADYVWSRGFTLETDVALKCGDVEVPAGNYAFAFQLDGEGKKWSMLIMPTELARANRQRQMALRRGNDTADIEKKIAELTKQGVKNITLPTETFAGKAAEHMSVYAINYGYKSGGRRNPEPISGITAELRVSFGDLHIKSSFEEVFAAKKGDSPKPRRGR